MCGIGGWFSPQPPGHAAAQAPLARMLRAIGHRGPDGKGTVVDGHAAFAHARLAVIDPVGGVQPMWSADGRAVMVFNGEIYNYRELRARLVARGIVLRTQSDAEVVLASWLDRGAAALSELRGMYAFAIWNRAERVGALVRDPLGIKPLFVATDPAGALRFASEAKGILALDGRRPDLDAQALHMLLNLRYLPGQSSLFAGIRQLAPGEVVTWRPGAASASTRLAAAPSADYPDLRAALEDSVAAHLTADVEVGCYLSGGIDSATVAAFARRNLRGGPRAFTLPVGDDPRESEGAAATASALGLEHHPGAEPGADADTLGRVLFALEVPKVNALQSFALARHVRPHVKVALSGLGGDELFLGYNAHRIMQRLAQLDRWTPRALARGLGAASAAVLGAVARAPFGEPERAAGMLARLGDWPVVYGLLRNVWDSPALRRRLYGPRMLDAPLPGAFEWLRSAWPAHGDPLSALAEFEWSNKMVNDLLWHEDRVSMANGVEVRVPFVDARLRAWVSAHEARVPVAQRLGKRSLRAAVRGVVPDAVLTRPKSGFQIDAPTFVRGPLAGYVDHWLDDARVRDAGLFDPAGVRALRALPARRGHRWHYFMLYLMAQSQHWVDAFERGSMLDVLLRDGPPDAGVTDASRG